MPIQRLRQRIICGAAALMLSCTAYAESAENRDPLEGFNRAMFGLNEGIDKYALKPLAQGYRFIMPDIAETGVNNFFSNLSDVRSAANNLLQGKFERSLSDVSRVVLNSTFGLIGFLDLATPLGLEKHDEDFGQTLGYWGISSGPYIVLPLLGPTTLRDGLGRIPDMALDPLEQVDDIPTRNSLYALKMIDARVQLMRAEQIISGDKYLFVRDAYLQRREYLVNDGEIQVDYDDSNF